jgi:hypothetical protein
MRMASHSWNNGIQGNPFLARISFLPNKKPGLSRVHRINLQSLHRFVQCLMACLFTGNQYDQRQYRH